MVRRWHQLPLDRALVHVPGVLAALQEIVDDTSSALEGSGDQTRPDAGEGAGALEGPGDQTRLDAFEGSGDQGLASAPRLPDLGPAVIPDQVLVVVHDAVATADPQALTRLADRLTALRRALP